ncbi:unnamed protein product, partial [Adineta steineri]
KIIELNKNTRSIFDCISKSNSNNVHAGNTNDSIDISMQLSDNLDSTSKLLLNKNNDLLVFYNANKLNNEYDKIINCMKSNNLSFDDELNINNIVQPLLEEKEKIENEQISIVTIDNHLQTATRCDDKNVDYYCDLLKNKSQMDDSKFEMSISSKLNDEIDNSYPRSKITSLTHISTASVPHVEKSTKFTEVTEIKDSTLEKIEININQQSTMFNTSLTNQNYNASEYSNDLHSFRYESDKTQSLLPFYSRCLVLFEFANHEEHLIEVIELPRSSHRISRMQTYKKIRKRLTSVDLSDIDLTVLLRAVLNL